MLIDGLDKTPFLRTEESEKLLMQTWFEDLESYGFNDSSAPEVMRHWQTLRKESTKWFKPKDLSSKIRLMRSLESPEVAALPNLSDEQRVKNLNRLGGMMKTLKIGVKK